MRATERNIRFALLVRDTRTTEFKYRILELRAFANGAGCTCKFDSEGFELWTLRGNRRLFQFSNVAAALHGEEFRAMLKDLQRGCK